MPAAAWPCNTLGNHDSGRVFSHFADGRHDTEWAKLAVAVVLTLRGTPFLYYGEELGMHDGTAIVVDNRDGVASGVASMTLDGASLASHRIALDPDVAGTHEVRVVLGAAANSVRTLAL